MWRLQSIAIWRRRTPPLMVQTISHTVTQLAEPIPAVPGIGSLGPDYFVVTALVTPGKA